MSELHLDSLEITNFRCFEHLVIEKLGRVNLIVGKNSVGKTCLLEAIRLYATKAHRLTLWQTLSDRGEVSGLDDIGLNHIEPIFYKWKATAGSAITIGELNNNEGRITIEVSYCMTDNDNQIIPRIIPLDKVPFLENVQLGLVVTSEKNPQRIYKLPISMQPGLWMVDYSSSRENWAFVPTGGIGPSQAAQLWDKAILEGTDYMVLDALHILMPRIKNLNMVAEQEKPDKRSPFARIENQEKPVRLSSMGDGVMRLLGIALSMLKAKDGYLLIDEFENGLHHSAQTRIWKFIFVLAKKLNAQVFATTHSWDCVEAFQEAAAENEEDKDAMLIRLQRKKDGTTIKAVGYDKREMDIVTRQGIEVR